MAGLHSRVLSGCPTSGLRPEVSAKCAEATPEGGTLHSGKRLGALWVETVGNSADMLTVCLMCLFAAGVLHNIPLQ